MENIHTSETGAVLITALLFLLILTMLAMSIVHIGLLETKMSKNYQDKIFATQQAEQNLIQKEQQLNSGNLSVATVISTAICGVTFYRIEAEGQYHHAKTNIHSTYAIIGDTSHCDPKPTIHPGRQSWR